jgi:hypothetical protein
MKLNLIFRMYMRKVVDNFSMLQAFGKKRKLRFLRQTISFSAISLSNYWASIAKSVIMSEFTAQT